MKRTVLTAVATAVLAATPLALADHHDDHTTRTTVERRETSTSESERLRSTIRVDNESDTRVASGCTYHSRVRGTITPVRQGRDEPANVQRLRPDLRVAGTIRCPNSTEAHIQERAVRSTGVTREELEHLIALNGSVARMQNTGRCMYVPEVSVTNRDVLVRDVNYLCPSGRSNARGGGPTVRTDRTTRDVDVNVDTNRNVERNVERNIQRNVDPNVNHDVDVDIERDGDIDVDVDRRDVD